MKGDSNAVQKAFLRDNEIRWSEKILLRDFIELRREVLHLKNKGHERELTAWEHKRIKECQCEMSEIFAKCTTAGIDLERLETVDSAAYYVKELRLSLASAGQPVQEDQHRKSGA